MKFVIPCSSRKVPRFWMYKAQQVRFVAHPDECRQPDSVLYCRPDDAVPSSSRTWREELFAYNQRGTNPRRLPRAADLYAPHIYRELANRCGWANTFILSAGWGLVRAGFLLPSYDITFSSQASACHRRRKGDTYNDFNHLRDCGTHPRETVYFCGGNNYLPLYYRLTRDLPARKVILHKAQDPPKEEGYVYIPYVTTQSTNWHYACAKDFIRGKLPA